MSRKNYKRLGDYIQLVDVRNVGHEVKNLLGLSISKKFISSVANIIGTDMENYKIIRRNQFACSTMQVRRDKKMPIALLQEVDEAIISQAYPIFEVKETNKLDPEYLMMWFSRSEFDREACFHAVGGVRGSLEWEDFENLQLPIPNIDKQKEIVKEYNVIQNRIALNQQLIEKLEETAQAIYKQWFVEFEFPDENGKPYKCNGGEMLWCEELGKEIPRGWEVGKIANLQLEISDGNYSGKYPKPHEFIKKGVPFIRGVDFENKTINPRNLIFISETKHNELKKGHLKKGDVLITTRGASIGKFAYVTDEFVSKNINSQLIRINGKSLYSNFYLGCMISTNTFTNLFESYSTGSAQPQLPVKNFTEIDVIVPENKIVKNFDRFRILIDFFLLKSQESQKLTELKDLLLAKLATGEG